MEANRPSIAACKAYTLLKKNNVCEMEIFSEQLKESKIYIVEMKNVVSPYYSKKPCATKKITRNDISCTSPETPQQSPASL